MKLSKFNQFGFTFLQFLIRYILVTTDTILKFNKNWYQKMEP